MMNKTPQPTDGLLLAQKPQYDKDIERAVLGAIIIDPSAYDNVREIIEFPECFYVDEHQRIYDSMLCIEQKGGKIDLLTVTEHLRTHHDIQGVNWAYFVTELASGIVTSAHVAEHAFIVVDLYRYRQLTIIGSELIQESFRRDEESEVLIDVTTSKLMELSSLIKQDSIVTAATAVMDSMNEIEEIMAKESPLLGIDTGIKTLNELTYGWQDTDLSIIAARPGQGKTSLALHFLLSTQMSSLHQPKNILFFSLEMSTSQLMKRLQSNLSGIEMNKIFTGKLSDTEFNKLNEASMKIGGMNIWIDDKAGLTTQQIRARTKRLKKLHGVDMVVVDYLQLITPINPKGKTENQYIGEISADLKRIAKDMNVPVIALCQMNRGIENRNTPPKLSDLRSSGSIEQDASVVIFIHSYMNEENKWCTDLVVEKNRNGSVGTVPVVFDRIKQRWYDAESTPDDVFAQPEGVFDNPFAGINPPKKENIFGDNLEDVPW